MFGLNSSSVRNQGLRQYAEIRFVTLVWTYADFLKTALLF